MRSRSSSTAALLAVLLGFSSSLRAQPAKAPSLDEILKRLEANLKHYDASVPSLFCDEHVISSQVAPHQSDENTVTDSIFRLRRTAGPDHTATLAESREIRSVNGKPAASQDMGGPTMLSGAFEGGFAVVSLSQTACMRYELQPIHRSHSAAPYVIHFATALTPANTADCLLQEKSQGRVFVDPASMQITRLEIDTRHHLISEGDASTSGMVGRRVITVDYAPIQLGARPSGCHPRSPCGSRAAAFA